MLASESVDARQELSQAATEMEGIFFVNFSLSASFLGLVGRRPDLLSVSPAARLGHGVVRTRPREVAAQMPRWARDGYFSSIVQTGRKIPRMCEEVHSLRWSAGIFLLQKQPKVGLWAGRRADEAGDFDAMD